MKPLLFSLHLGRYELPVHTYGFFVAIGFAIGITLAARQARRAGLDGDGFLDLSFWILVAGVLASRLTYVLVHAGEYARLCATGAGGGAPRPIGRAIADCAAPLRLWEGGLVFYGGALGAALVVALFCRRRGWSFATVADVFAPSLAVGHAFGRLGCFAAGCCFGKTWQGPLAVSFPRGSVAFDELAGRGLVASGALGTPAVHPTQLYEAAGEALIFALLLALRRRRLFPGALALAYALAYALLRFVVELFRGDAARMFVAELRTPGLSALLGVPPEQPLFLSLPQVVSLMTVAVATVFLVVRGARYRQKPPEHAPVLQ